MIRIHTLLIGQPQEIRDAKGIWHSAIYRAPVDTPVRLHLRRLEGDQVADTEHHGSPDQAVCCHPLAHYAAWKAFYAQEAAAERLGPGSVGENWTLEGATEQDVCIGDIFGVGTAQIQISGPRYPCSKQERKVGLPDFLRQTVRTLRTGFYLRVVMPGMVQTGDEWTLQSRSHPDMTVQQVNACAHHDFDPEFAKRALDVPELAAFWKYVYNIQLRKS